MTTQPKNSKDFFTHGPIKAAFVSETITRHAAKKNIGAHDIFLGQVRQDIIENRVVKAIEYSSYSEMATKELQKIRDQMINKHKLICAHISHSQGLVHAGEICLFVFVSSVHRKSAFDACHEMVELIKKDVPIFGKEIFEDGTHTWKENQ